MRDSAAKRKRTGLYCRSVVPDDRYQMPFSMRYDATRRDGMRCDRQGWMPRVRRTDGPGEAMTRMAMVLTAETTVHWMRTMEGGPPNEVRASESGRVQRFRASWAVHYMCIHGWPSHTPRMRGTGALTVPERNLGPNPGARVRFLGLQVAVGCVHPSTSSSSNARAWLG